MKGGLRSAGEDRAGTRSKEARQNRQFQARWPRQRHVEDQHTTR
jgi:hypothetical protein